MDHFRLTVADLPPLEKVTKRLLVSDIAKTFDVLSSHSHQSKDSVAMIVGMES